MSGVAETSKPGTLTLTVSAGSSATSTVSVSAYGGFGGSIAYTCAVFWRHSPGCLWRWQPPTPGTPPGDYVITVTGTDSSGTPVSSVPIPPITVQSDCHRSRGKFSGGDAALSTKQIRATVS